MMNYWSRHLEVFTETKGSPLSKKRETKAERILNS